MVPVWGSEVASGLQSSPRHRSVREGWWPGHCVSFRSHAPCMCPQIIRRRWDFSYLISTVSVVFSLLAAVCLFHSADFYCHAGPFGWQVRWQCWCFSVRAGGDVPYRFGVLLVMLFGQHPESFNEFCRTHSLKRPEYCLKLPSLEHLVNFW